MCPLFGGRAEEESASQKALAKRLDAEGADDASVSASAVERLLLMRSAEKELNSTLTEK